MTNDKNITVAEALKEITRITNSKLTLSEVYELYDLIGAVNMSGWLEGRKQAIEYYAPDHIKRVLLPILN